MTFYKMLGMKFQEEQHGSGPVHWAADLDGIVLEIYPAESADEVDATTRMGFDVKDATFVLNTLRLCDVEIIAARTPNKTGYQLCPGKNLF